ncbi:hypothetical protein [Leifsonia sp. Root1293]|uniref:hypothetical protein n=1 Tax=Leifsonia sp. Root1293 TaxID=1736446 RepID=UPI000AB9A610|nr:hypothetical protein [Leifsonia sp. Root1293]
MAAAPYSPSVAPAPDIEGAEDALSRVQELQARIRGMQATKLESPALPTSAAMAAVLPSGALRQGSAYSVDGSLTLAMALLAGPSASGAWCGVVGVPDFGAEAASRFGIDLERLVLVPDPGEHWLTATAALVDVLTVVVLRPPARASDTDVARLGARLRQRGAALVVLGPWPQAEARLSISSSSWTGLGDGHGHLAAREATVTAIGRLGYDRPRSVRLWLPDGHQQFGTVESPDAAQLRRDGSPLLQAVTA